MRQSEFWVRMDAALGAAYARSWASQFVMAELGGRTASEALAQGETPRTVWRAVWAALELPVSER